jgi:hypothetical protein
MLKKLMKRELGIKPYKIINICYVAIHNPYRFFDESIVKGIFTGKYDKNANLYNSIAFEREEEAIAHILSIFKIEKNNLKKGTYCIVTVKGKSQEITSLLSTVKPHFPYSFHHNHGVGFGERVISVRDNTNSIFLFRDEVLENYMLSFEQKAFSV